MAVYLGSNKISGGNQISGADYVVDQGYDATTGMYYRKWDSGIAECNGIMYYHGLVNSQYGNGYIGDRFSVNFPEGLFNGVPRVFVSPQYSQKNFEIVRCQWSYPSNTWSGEYKILTQEYVGESLSEPFQTAIFATGTWK